MLHSISKTLMSAALLLSASPVLAGGPPAKDGESKRSYEMSMFDEETSVQGPGMQLAVPGDMIRYTYVIDDEFINDPAYTLSRAVFGVHIIDSDLGEDGTDGAQEWGAIYLDGEPRETRDGELTDFMEMRSDHENEKKLPPYIFNIPELIADDGTLVLEVLNLNKDGGKDRSTDYGDFNMLRAGLHLFYVKAAQ